KRAADAEPGDAVGLQLLDRLTLEDDIARGRGNNPAEHVEERSLAGAVGTDHTEDLAGAHLQADIVHRREAGEPPRKVTDLQHRSVRYLPRSEGAATANAARATHSCRRRAARAARTASAAPASRRKSDFDNPGRSGTAPAAP